METLAGTEPSLEQDRRARAAYAASLSSSATFALAGIFVSGFFSAWHNFGGVRALVDTSYGNTLLAKLTVVGGAVSLADSIASSSRRPGSSARQAAREALPHRFTRVLQVQAVVLLDVLVLAALLASTSPPDAPL
jgi:putative copper resistance protein D